MRVLTHKIQTLALLLILFSSTANAATVDQVKAWRNGFPAPRTELAKLRECAAAQAWLVNQATTANLERTLRMMRERLEKDLAIAKEILRSTKGGRATGKMRHEAQEVNDWIMGALVTFINRAPR